MKRLTSLILLFALASLALVSCKDEPDATWGWCELGMVLDEKFEKEDTGGAFDVAYSDGLAVVGFTRMSFEAAINDGIPETLSAYKFSEEYKKRTDLEDYVTLWLEDVPYISYYTDEGIAEYFHIVAFYRSHHAYFAVVFVVNSTYQWDYRIKFNEFMLSAYLDYENQKG